MDEGTRLNKYLASCGEGSRRACDALIQEGHVEINGHPCLNPAERVGPDDHVKMDGRRVTPKAVGCIMLNKPRGLVSSKDDEFGRETVFELLPGSLQHLNHVGRLDRDSEGLLVLTNDGNLAQAMLHPSKHIEKEYIVTANQPVSDEHLRQFLTGLYTEDGKMVAKEVERLSPRRIRVVLITGHKRQIRVMFKTLGYTVQRLFRIRIGSFELTDIPPGKWRQLEPKEIESLLQNPTGRKARAKARRPGDRKSAPLKGARKTARKLTKKAAKKTARKAPKRSAKQEYYESDERPTRGGRRRPSGGQKKPGHRRKF